MSYCSIKIIKGRINMQSKYGWNATASERSGWFGKSILTHSKSIAPLMVAFASMPFFAWFSSYWYWETSRDMKESVVIVCVSVLILFIQSCSSTEEFRFENITDYELTRYNLLKATPEQIVCFSPSRGFISGRFQRTKEQCFTIREIGTYSILTRRSANDAARTGGFETDKGDF